MRLTPALLVALAGLPLAAVAEPTLYLGMNGGTMERLYADSVLPAFEKAHNVKVVIVPGTSADWPGPWRGCPPRSRPVRRSRRSM